MINLNKTHQIADIIHETIQYSGLESAIISTPIFNRLHRILQSSLVGLTFSSNKVKRFEHSLGVMHLAGKILFHSLNNVDDENLLNSVLEDFNNEIVKWINALDYSKERALDPHFADSCDSKTIFNFPVPNSSFYRQNLPIVVTDKYKYSYLVFFEATRIAGLLHDVGHLPYSHICEHAIQQLYGMVKSVKQKNKAQKEFLDILRPYCGASNNDENKELHEEIGINLVKQIKSEIVEELHLQRNYVNYYVLMVLDFALEILSAKNSENTIFSDIHKIIAGVLDADRLDYCSRDLYCSGVRKDVFHYNRLLSNYKIIRKQQTFDLDGSEKTTRDRILFCPSVKNIIDAEELIERRWKINTSINFHHRVHKHESIFSEILAHIGYDELQSKNEGLKELEHGKPLPLELSSIWQLVKKLNSNNSLIDYFIIQLDDGWLDTLLKHEFFAKYTKDYRNKQKYSIDSQWNKFDELISSSKHYYSAYKRSADFRQLDYDFGNAWIEYVKDKKTNSLIEMVTSVIRWNNREKNVLLNLNKIMTLVLSNSRAIFINEIEKELNKSLNKNNWKKINITDCMIRHCNDNLGFTESAPVYFWKDSGGEAIFEEVSLIRRVLTMRQGTCLPFHLYYLPKNNVDKVQLDLLAKLLISIMVKKIYKLIKD